MNVYVLCTGGYEDYREIGVYSSKKTAKAEIERIEGKKIDLRSYQGIYIHTYVVDAPTTDEQIVSRMNYVPSVKKEPLRHRCPLCGYSIEYEEDTFTWCDVCDWQGFPNELFGGIA